MKIEWENIEHNRGGYLQRAKIPGGWLVMITNNVTTVVADYELRDGFEWRESICFVPDINHEWK